MREIPSAFYRRYFDAEFLKKALVRVGKLKAIRVAHGSLNYFTENVAARAFHQIISCCGMPQALSSKVSGN